MKIFLRKNKLALWLGVVFILLFVGFMVLMSCIQRQMLIDAHKESLQILANEKAAQVNMFLEFQKEKLLLLISMDVFKEAILHPDDASKLGEAKKVIDEFGGTAALFTDNGILIYANNAPASAGVDYSKDPYFILKAKKIIFGRYYDMYEKKDFYIIIGPIYDNKEKNKVIGAVGFHIPLDDISSLIRETIESKTNEVYLIDETGLLLSGSKYVDQGNKNGVLIQEVESDGAKVCLEHVKKYGKNESVEEHIEEVIQYTNYMGNKVFGAHAYVTAIMGCVIAEENADEVSKFSMIDYIKNIFNK